MADRTQFAGNDPRYHTAKLKQMLKDTIEQAREDIEKVSDPKAEALFETASEVLGGLVKAFDHFEGRTEPAWKVSASSRG